VTAGVGAEKNMTRGFKITLAILGCVVVVILIQPIPHCIIDRNAVASASTRAELESIACASKAYFRIYGHWPLTLSALTNNPQQVVFVEFQTPEVADGWGRSVLYRPYDVTLGYGSVMSLGKDGKRGGTGHDKDLEAQFSEKDKSTNHASEPSAASAPQVQR
jgi:hypothetical protein